MSVPDGRVCIVSIAELPNNSSRSFSTVGADFERTPPQDLIAEQSVLGAMMLSKDAIADVIEVIRERDFYRPAHELIFDAILDLYGRGEPADAITVSAELTKRGDIARAGGAPYLHTLDLISAYCCKWWLLRKNYFGTCNYASPDRSGNKDCSTWI
jgi:hypothetical protein